MEPCWTAFADDANLFVLLSVLARAPLQGFSLSELLRARRRGCRGVDHFDNVYI